MEGFAVMLLTYSAACSEVYAPLGPAGWECGKFPGETVNDGG